MDPACPGPQKLALSSVRRDVTARAGRACPDRDGHEDPRGPTDRGIGGDDRDLLLAPILGREALEERVGVLGPANLERAMALVRALAVEHQHSPRALCCDPTREQVAQLLRRAEVAGVQE